MAAYTFKRLATGLVSLIVLATVTFFLVRLIPGSPFQNGGVSSQVVEAVEEEYGLNEPLFDQYLTYMGNLVREIWRLLPGAGHNGGGDHRQDLAGYRFAGAGSPFGGSAPWHGTWDPEGGVKEKSGPRGHFSRRDASCRNPQFCRCDPPSPCVQRETWVVSLGGTSDPRSLCAPGNLADALSDGCHLPPDRKYLAAEMGKQYVLFARAKGLGRARILFTHALKNAWIPVLNYVGPASAFLLTGSFVVESIFTIPGLGREFVSSITNRDYTLILGLTVFMGAVVILVNLVTDLVCAWMDPRCAGHTAGK